MLIRFYAQVTHYYYAGGSWCYTALALPASYRLKNDPSYRIYYLGFRVVRRCSC